MASLLPEIPLNRGLPEEHRPECQPRLVPDLIVGLSQPHPDQKPVNYLPDLLHAAPPSLAPANRTAYTEDIPSALGHPASIHTRIDCSAPYVYYTGINLNVNAYFGLDPKRRGEDVEAAHTGHAGQVTAGRPGHPMGRAAKFRDRVGAVLQLAVAPYARERASL